MDDFLLPNTTYQLQRKSVLLYKILVYGNTVDAAFRFVKDLDTKVIGHPSMNFTVYVQSLLIWRFSS